MAQERCWSERRGRGKVGHAAGRECGEATASHCARSLLAALGLVTGARDMRSKVGGREIGWVMGKRNKLGSHPKTSPIESENND